MMLEHKTAGLVRSYRIMLDVTMWLIDSPDLCFVPIQEPWEIGSAGIITSLSKTS